MCKTKIVELYFEYIRVSSILGISVYLISVHCKMNIEMKSRGVGVIGCK